IAVAMPRLVPHRLLDPLEHRRLDHRAPERRDLAVDVGPVAHAAAHLALVLDPLERLDRVDAGHGAGQADGQLGRVEQLLERRDRGRELVLDGEPAHQELACGASGTAVTWPSMRRESSSIASGPKSVMN